jgi:pseudouridine kinase
MKGPVTCIGTAIVDELFFSRYPVIPGTSNPSEIKRFPGGVVCNVARHLGRLGLPVSIISILGKDGDGDWLEASLANAKVNTEGLIRVEEATGKFAALIEPDGNLYTAACHDLAEQYLTPARLEEMKETLSASSMIIADTNLSLDSLSWLSDFSLRNHIPFVIEPVSVPKSRKITALPPDSIWMTTPNQDEVLALAEMEEGDEYLQAISVLQKRGMERLWLRQGARGSVFFHAGEKISLAAKPLTVVDSTGAGDAALAGWVAGWYWGFTVPESMQLGHCLAFEVLQQQGASLPNLTKQKALELMSQYYGQEA